MLDKADLFAALVNATGGVFTWMNVYKLYTDKRVQGTNAWSFVYYGLASCYTAGFLHHLHAHFAFMGTMITATGNMTWAVLAFHYKRLNTKGVGCGIP